MIRGHASRLAAVVLLAGTVTFAGPATLDSAQLALAHGGADGAPVPWVLTADVAQVTLDADLVERGRRYASRYGCAACHSLDGSRRPGPTWQGLYRSNRPLANGQNVIADEAYLRRSIITPDAQLAQGFPEGFMPNDFGRKVSEEELQAIIELIKSVR